MLTDKYIFNALKQKKQRTRPVSKGPRVLVPGGNKPFDNVPKSLKEECKRQFPDVEIIYNNKINRFEVYRVLQKKNGADDILVHEFTIKDPLGPWLIAHMLKHDSFRKYNSDHRELLVNRELDDEYKKREEKHVAKRHEANERLIKAYEFVDKEKVSVSFTGL